MQYTNHLTAYLSARATARWTTTVARRDERGDVPGWVLVTVMSVGIVAALSGLAKNELSAILQRALSSVTH